MADHSALDREYYKKPPEPVDYAYTLEHEGKVLIIGGFRMITDATALCWIDLSDIGMERIFTCYRAIVEWMDMFCHEHNIVRLEACVRSGFDKGARLVEHLGFEFEGRKPRYFEAVDGLLYVRYFGV
jgi:hypothetical protein